MTETTRIAILTEADEDAIEQACERWCGKGWSTMPREMRTSARNAVRLGFVTAKAWRDAEAAHPSAAQLDAARRGGFEEGAEWATMRYLPTGHVCFYADATKEAARRYPPPKPAPVEYDLPSGLYKIRDNLDGTWSLANAGNAVYAKAELAAYWLRWSGFTPADGAEVLRLLEGKV